MPTKVGFSLALISIVSLAAATSMIADETGSVQSPFTADATLRAEGVWRSGDHDYQWSVGALRLGNNEVRGRVSLTGLSKLTGANVEARLSGRGVVGKLLDDDGRILAVFEGAVGRSGASGTFRHVGGGSGTWKWDAPDRTN